MKPIAKILIVFGTVMAIGYGIAYGSRQSSLIKDTTFTPVSYSLSKFSLNNSQLDITARIENKSDFNFRVYYQYYDVYLGDTKIATVEDDSDFLLPKKGGSADTTFKIQFSIIEVLKGAYEGYAKSGDVKDVPLRIVGSLSTSTSGVLFNSFPLDMSFTLRELIETKS